MSGKIDATPVKPWFPLIVADWLDSDDGWIDLGFRLAQPHWGQGLATEAASAWVRVAFDEYQINRLGAFVHPENAASIRVLEKLGFHAERSDTVMGMDSIVFSLDAKTGKGSR